MQCYPMIQTSLIVESAYSTVYQLLLDLILFESDTVLNSKKKTESIPSFTFSWDFQDKSR